MRMERGRGRSAADERIAQLEAELDEAWHDIVDLAPEGMPELLTGYHSCGSREEHHRWRQQVVAAVTARAVAEPDSLRWQPRARCPLCRSGGLSSYQSGFTLPEGLSRHLEGFGNVRRCVVTEAAFRLAREHLQGCFREEEEVARRLEEGRRSSERLYQIAPWSAPKLVDEGPALWGRPPRDAKGLQAAERRLADLGFQTEVDGSVVSYRLVRDGLVVFADPRAEGRTDFVVCREGARTRGADHAAFYLLDTWKDAGGKFDRRLAGAVEALAGRKQRQPR